MENSEEYIFAKVQKYAEQSFLNVHLGRYCDICDKKAQIWINTPYFNSKGPCYIALCVNCKDLDFSKDCLIRKPW